MQHRHTSGCAECKKPDTSLHFARLQFSKTLAKADLNYRDGKQQVNAAWTPWAMEMPSILLVAVVTHVHTCQNSLSSTSKVCASYYTLHLHKVVFTNERGLCSGITTNDRLGSNFSFNP